MQIERINCNLTSAIINVEDNEIKNINQSNNRSKSEYAYLNGLLSERKEFQINGFLLFTYTYDYEMEGRIIEIN